jgi:hypothetical protein
MPLPIPHHLRKSTDFAHHEQEQASKKEESKEKRTRPTESDLIKAYYFMIKEVSSSLFRSFVFVAQQRVRVLIDTCAAQSGAWSIV